MPLQGTYGVRTGMDNRLMYDPDWAVNIKALQDFLYNDKTAEEVIAATLKQPRRRAHGKKRKKQRLILPGARKKATRRMNTSAEICIR